MLGTILCLLFVRHQYPMGHNSLSNGNPTIYFTTLRRIDTAQTEKRWWCKGLFKNKFKKRCK
jgi:hypothetical protein